MKDIYEDYDYTEKVENDYQLNEENMNTKKFYESKTVWFNVIVFVVAFLALPEFISVLPAVWLPYAVLGGTVGNLILRIWFTSTEVK